MKPILNISLITLFSVFTLSACMQENDNTTELIANPAEEKTPLQQSKSGDTPNTEEQTTNIAQQNEVEETTDVSSTGDQASELEQFIEGQHYRTLNFELPTEAPAGKIEVTELFWYGCPHCFHLEPTMKEYQKEKGDHVYFRRVPATLNPQWEIHAKAFYIMQLLDPDGTKHIHDKIFNAIHKQHRRLRDEEAIKNFFISQGYTEEEVNNAANSMEIQAKLKMATDYSTTSQATGVPTLIVNGKYMTSPTMAQGAVKLKRVLKFLVDKSTKE